MPLSDEATSLRCWFWCCLLEALHEIETNAGCGIGDLVLSSAKAAVQAFRSQGCMMAAIKKRQHRLIETLSSHDESQELENECKTASILLKVALDLRWVKASLEQER